MPEAPPTRRTSRLNRWLAVALIVSAVALLAWLGWRAARAALYARAALDDLDRLQAVLANAFAGRAAPGAGRPGEPADAPDRGAGPRPGHSCALRRCSAGRPRSAPDLAQAPQLARHGRRGCRRPAGWPRTRSLLPPSLAAGGGGLDALPEAVDGLRKRAGRPWPRRKPGWPGRRLCAAAMPPLTEPRLVAQQLDRVDKLLPLAQRRAEAGRGSARAARRGRAANVPAAGAEQRRAAGDGRLHQRRGARYARPRQASTDLALKDSYAVDNWEQPHPTPPAALTKHMAADLWVLRDSNWSPDFPDAADVARRSVCAGPGGARRTARSRWTSKPSACSWAQSVPLQVPGVAEPVTGDNALEWMKEAWESPAGSDRGAGERRRRRAGGSSARISWASWSRRRWRRSPGRRGDLDLARHRAGAAYAALDGRHLQVALDDPTLRRRCFAERGWDGGMRPPDGERFPAGRRQQRGFQQGQPVRAADHRLPGAMRRRADWRQRLSLLTPIRAGPGPT